MGFLIASWVLAAAGFFSMRYAYGLYQASDVAHPVRDTDFRLPYAERQRIRQTGEARTMQMLATVVSIIGGLALILTAVSGSADIINTHPWLAVPLLAAMGSLFLPAAYRFYRQKTVHAWFPKMQQDVVEGRISWKEFWHQAFVVSALYPLRDRVAVAEQHLLPFLRHTPGAAWRMQQYARSSVGKFTESSGSNIPVFIPTMVAEASPEGLEGLELLTGLQPAEVGERWTYPVLVEQVMQHTYDDEGWQKVLKHLADSGSLKVYLDEHQPGSDQLPAEWLSSLIRPVEGSPVVFGNTHISPGRGVI